MKGMEKGIEMSMRMFDGENPPGHTARLRRLESRLGSERTRNELNRRETTQRLTVYGRGMAYCLTVNFIVLLSAKEFPTLLLD